jgi:hypothetical protein
MQPNILSDVCPMTVLAKTLTGCCFLAYIIVLFWPGALGHCHLRTHSCLLENAWQQLAIDSLQEW